MRFAVWSMALAGMFSCFRGGTSSSSIGSPTAGASTDAATKQLIEEAGNGRCRADVDCVLSDYEPGCCKRACEPTAVNRADIAATIAQEGESCEALRERELCPPTDECPPSKRTVVSAKCVKATCYRVVEVMTPKS